MDDVKNRTSEIVRHYLTQFHLTPGQLAERMNAVFAPHGSYSRMAVVYWTTGEQKPDYYKMVYLFHNTNPNDLLHDFAHEILVTIDTNFKVVPERLDS